MLIGIVPAAGHARRMGGESASKEVLEVGGRPVMEYVVERMQAAGTEAIRVVCRPEKADVVAHARRLGLQPVLGHPPETAESVRLGCRGLAGDDRVLIGFPDSIWQPPDGFSRLLEELEPGVRSVLGLFKAPEPERSDVVDLDGRRVTAVHVKPPEPPSDLIWGVAALEARVVLDELADGEPLGHLFGRLAASGHVRGVHLSDTWMDVGTPEALRAARAALASPPQA